MIEWQRVEVLGQGVMYCADMFGGRLVADVARRNDWSGRKGDPRYRARVDCQGDYRWAYVGSPAAGRRWVEDTIGRRCWLGDLKEQTP